MKNALFIPRSYRSFCDNKRFVSFTVKNKESDLFILAKRDLTIQAQWILSELRNDIESYIQMDLEFLTSLRPMQVLEDAPGIIKEMAESSARMNVGPMASVAGAISENVARYLCHFSDEVIVENGGDDFIINKEPVTIALYAGDSPFSMKIGIELMPNPDGISVCTSSGTVGHSLSFGNADAVTIIAKSGSFADAAATAICNIIKSKEDIQNVLEFTRKIPEILGIVIILKEDIGVRGEIISLKWIDS
jgi:ApbE superfamily uncharacterized protein (UPF0280 family)|uniref:UPF0280 family protein n=1 Tax=candidate division WOR-3 bacterium TaxID=2052148 RepID=A0A7V3RG34_UNCW3